MKIDIYAPREAADLVVVHDPAYPKMHNGLWQKNQQNTTRFEAFVRPYIY